MENTIIRKKDGRSIDSEDCQSFQLNVSVTRQSIQRIKNNPEARSYPSKIELVAYTLADKIEVIASFDSTDDTGDACNALLSLLEAIGKEVMWDANELNSDQESNEEPADIKGPVIPPSGGIEPTDGEQTDIKGTEIKPSNC